MKCERVQYLLPEYDEGLLSAKETAAIEAHIASCKECERELKSIRASWQLVTEHAGNAEPPIGLWNGVYNKITDGVEERKPRFTLPWLTKPIKAVGAMVATAALVAGVLYGTMFTPQQHIAPMNASTSEYAQGHAIYAGQTLLADKVSYGSIVAESTHDPLGGSK